MSRREEGKADRRRRIVLAARELIQETGDTGLSMRAIAAKANVSLATPYNLFGSKRAIVMAVLDDVREFHERFASIRQVDPVERFFKAIAVMLSYHAEDPVFYRTLWASIFDMGSSTELRTELLSPQGYAFWQNLLDEAAADGVFLKEIDQAALLRQLNFTFSSALLAWVLNALTMEELEPAMCYGYALTLASAATDEHRPRIFKRALEFQRRLVRLRKRGVEATPVTPVRSSET